MILLKLLIFSFLKLTTCQFHQSDIDAQLSATNNALRHKEARISLVLSNFSQQMTNCSEKVKNFHSLVTTLSNFNELVKSLMTISDFGDYENISTCGDINYKITMLDFDIQFMQRIILKIYQNTTLINQQFVALVTTYNLNLKALEYLSDKERSVSDVIARTRFILLEYTDLIRILTTSIGKISLFNSLLTIFKRQYCPCLERVAWTGSTSTLDKNLQVVENQLIEQEKKIRNCTTIAISKLKNVKTRVTSLSTLLTSFLTTSDYATVRNWTNVQNCNDMWLRMKFLQFRRMRYVEILQTVNSNYFSTLRSRLAINSTSRGSSRELSIAMNATMILEDEFKIYINKLIFSIVKIGRFIADFNYYGDTYCSCGIDDGERTSTSTSTSTSTTTTIKPVCGALVPYDPVNSPNDPTIYGLLSGKYYDGSNIYAGTAFGNCGGQNPCPARITTTSGIQGPGGYTSCGGSPFDIFDKVNVKYFLAHSQLQWIPTTQSTYSSVVGIIPVVSVFTMYLGRINMNIGNGTFQQIGKIYNGVLYYHDVTTNTEKITTSYDILACAPVTTTSTTTTTTTMQPCGTLKSFDSSSNEIQSLGFPSGLYYDNTEIYPGTGNFATCGNQNPGAARIQTSSTNKGPGAYYSCGGGEQFDNKEPKFFLNHPNLKWIATTASAAPNVPGVIIVNNPHGKFLVGRIDVTFSNVTFKQIGKWEGSEGRFYYTGSDLGSYTFTTGAFEVLACQP